VLSTQAGVSANQEVEPQFQIVELDMMLATTPFLNQYNMAKVPHCVDDLDAAQAQTPFYRQLVGAKVGGAIVLSATLRAFIM